MYNLASVIKKQRRWGEAEKLFRQVLEKKCSAFGEDHPDTMMGCTTSHQRFMDSYDGAKLRSYMGMYWRRESESSAKTIRIPC